MHREACNFHSDHYALYEKYIRQRHPEGGMSADIESYQRLLENDWCDTSLYVMSINKQPVSIAITDHLQDGLSAVYTFFDPALSQRSLGNFSILWQIQHAREIGLDWLYLGYWIKEHPKMAYKSRFQPFQAFDGHTWR